MKSLHLWVKSHPLKAVCFSVFFAFLTPILALREDDWANACLLLMGVGLVVFALVVFSDARKLMLCLLGLACAHHLNAQPVPSREGGTGGSAGCAVAAGVVVIVVGTYAGYKIVKFCQRHFGRPTNSVPTIGASNSTESEGGAWDISPMGSCYSVDDTDCHAGDGAGGAQAPEPTSFYITGQVLEQYGKPSVQARLESVFGSDHTVSFAALANWAAAQGLLIRGQGGNERSFSRNGVPIPEDESIIHFDTLAHSVSVYRDWSKVRRVEISRSQDLRTWTPLIAIQQEIGSTFRIEDTTSGGQMFYRMEVVNPD